MTSAAGVGLAVLVVAGCGPGNGKTATDAQSGKAAVRAVASSTAIQKDESAVASQIVSPCVTKATGLHPVKNFEDCVEAKVPQADRATLKSCLVKAAGVDNVLTKTGRKTWLDVSANQCVTAAMPGMVSSPSPAASK